MQWVVVTIGVLCGVYVCCVGGCVLIVCPKFLVCGILDACFIYMCLCVCVCVFNVPVCMTATCMRWVYLCFCMMGCVFLYVVWVGVCSLCVPNSWF